MGVTLTIDHMDSRRWGERELPVLLSWVVCRDEPRTEHGRVRDGEERDRAAERVHAASIRGSHTTSSRSPTALPASNSTDEATTPARTIGVSRDRTASTSNGPTP